MWARRIRVGSRGYSLGSRAQLCTGHASVYEPDFPRGWGGSQPKTQEHNALAKKL